MKWSFMKTEKYLTVTAVTRYLKAKFDQDDNLKLIFLKGEISNFKAHTTGHFYFSLKDETSKINAVMFNANAKKMTFLPNDGMKVLLVGRVSVYEATGNYQIYVEEMIEDGVGNLYLAFEKLKEKLSKEGLFEEQHKKIIPKMPMQIGVVTAPTGAAVRDIISTIKRRFPIAEVILFPTLVQGDKAALDIAHQIEKANTFPIDVLIVGRGGGSIEDLWPFNEEAVARAIYQSKVPIISAVGHEVDYTISDFVADLRAPTPTGAAELAVPNLLDLLNQLSQYKIRTNEAMNRRVNYQKLYLDSLKNSFVIKSPMLMYENKKQKLDIFLEKISGYMIRTLENHKNRLQHLENHYLLVNPKRLYQESQTTLAHWIEKLELLNPLHILQKGYALPYHDHKIIRDIHSLKINDAIELKLHTGIIKTQIIEIKEEKHGRKNTKI